MSTSDEQYPFPGQPFSLAKAREILGESLKSRGIDIDELDKGSDHPYSCTCKTCWGWWVAMGLGNEGDAAPFTQAQIEAATYDEARLIGPFDDYLGMPGDVLRPVDCANGNHVWALDPNRRGARKCPSCGLEWQE